MTTEQIDNYLTYILSVGEAYKIARPESYKYSEDSDKVELEDTLEENS